MIVNGRDVHRDNTTSSHMPIQMELIKIYNPKSILELGVGYYSTKLYLDNSESLTSIESDSTDWFELMESHFNSYPNWNHLMISGLDNIRDYLKGNRWDLIFVDGDEFRSEETNLSFECSDIIVCHDTQWYFRDKWNVPKDFYQIDFKNFGVSYGHIAGYSENPWTTLFVKNKDIYQHFLNIERVLYNNYIFPYVYDESPNKNNLTQ